MRVLVLAPQPFFVERGTPIAVRLLVRTLADLGHDVDLLTFHEGSEADLGGARLHRTWAVPGIRNIGPGLSAKKIVCDAALTAKSVAMIRRRRYDVIHAVEEAAFLATVLGRVFDIPFVYDMDSSLPEQISDRLPLPDPMIRLMETFEAAAIRSSSGVVAVCQALVDRVGAVDPAKPVVLLQDISLLEKSPPEDVDRVTDLRKELAIDGALLLYVGNLEPYQGIDLMVESFAIVASREERSCLVVIGGDDADIRSYRRKTRELGVQDRVHLPGPRPVRHLGSYLSQADILVSPRIRGSNTPLKIYSYMDSGIPVLATRLPTHEQVLDDEVAELADPSPEAFAAGMLRLIEDVEHRDRLAEAAERRVAERHSYEAYRRKLGDFYRELAHDGPVGRRHE